MKRIIILTVTIAALFTGCIEFVDNSKRTNPWDPLGAFAWTALETGFTPTSASMVSAEFYNGTTYITYLQSGNGGGVICGKFTSSWTKIGANIFDIGFGGPNPAGAAMTLYSNGTICVGYDDGSLQGIVATNVGTAWNSAGAYAPCHNDTTSIAVTRTNLICVAYRYTLTTLYVNNHAQQFIGGSAFSGAGVMPGEVKLLASKISNRIFLVYTDSLDGNKLCAMQCHSPGVASGTWATIGATTNIIAGGATYVSAVIDSADNLYIAFRDETFGNKLTVIKYNGSSWSVLGTSGLSEATVTWASMAIGKSDIPYVAYSDNARSGKLTVKRYENGVWLKYGDGVSSAAASEIRLVADQSADALYVVFSDGGASGKLTIMKK